jgi:hypothetical protein
LVSPGSITDGMLRNNRSIWGGLGKAFGDDVPMAPGEVDQVRAMLPPQISMD